MKKKGTSCLSIILIIVISFFSGFFANSFLNTGTLTFQQTQLLNQAAKLIKNYGINEYDEEATVDYALKGMAASLDDPYAYYFTKEELTEYNNSITGVVEGGIGVQIVQENGQCVVASVYSGLTAKSAGIKANDVIIKVNDESIKGLDIEQISQKVKGEAGTSVKITVLRNDKELSFNVERSNGQRDIRKNAVRRLTKRFGGYFNAKEAVLE